MTRYGLVQDGEVVKVSSKPTSKRTSNLWLNEEAMKEEGWLPIDDKKPQLKGWQKKGARSEEILKTKINFNYTVEDRALEDFKQEKIDVLARNAEQAILGEGEYSLSVDPFLQRFDPRTSQNNADVKKVVDEYKAKKAEIESCTTYEEVEAVYLQIVAFVPADKLDTNNEIIVEQDELLV